MKNSHETLSLWLKELSQYYGKTFALNNRGECELAHGSYNLLIAAPMQSESLYFTVSLFKLTDEKSSLFMREALIQNRASQITSSASVALDPGSETLTLNHRRSVVDIDFNDFINIITNLLDKAKEITQTISDATRGQTIQSHTAEIPFDISMRV
ncbi:CesT family type III secretion system chaperone [Pleionea sp. CnH1-48]|uniref:CesT family type III secretion system chaperone n=1 Tax=Pleionea sp. CnH1-48 TaxID=2954494 RepID=UPI0020969486|nr:CesT family type III secretion system chaperone [Pleionea sp. CnH1-48]MCO7227007.1 CesT family type III secretion system chaperone [Pleionea sp. CnH1-48]